MFFAASIFNGELEPADMTEETRDIIEALVFIRDEDRAPILADALEDYAKAHAGDEGIGGLVRIRRDRRNHP
jgi:hypothetical protein